MDEDSITFKTEGGKEYHLKIDRMNSNILSAGSPGRVQKIAKYLDKSEIQEGSRKMTVVHGKYQKLPISAFSTGMGPASAAITVPEAIEAAEDPITLLRIGTAGSLQSHVKAGDIVIGTGAIRDESTTTAVVDSEYPSIANSELVPIMIAAAEKHGFEMKENLWPGITHVKDDLYFKETPHFSPSRDRMEPKLQSYREMGALSTSMEFSVYTIMRDFYKYQKKRDISVGLFLGIVAETKKKHSVKVDKKTKKKLENDMIKIGLDTLQITNDLRKGKKTDIDFEEIIRKLI
ncbi:hypothetical protein AKJ49_00575 [candidate division MSBL1 archaeon SCGC-AAA382A03]|uniref:Nucleoside phosphorylase domain-containing protein n=1 Tax=candidate division MSBL1 archaeon SCGC-AAA382A03 TaxID=1698278 RepID=A0A133VGG5_9EURY|nr:hypothetical protein AKJ49_00575 [candidate division MSBL1 archaeon SCGC-AAA382A03]